MSQVYALRGISAVLILSMFVILQPTPARGNFLPKVLLGTVVGTAAGVSVAKLEEQLEDDNGNVPVLHRVWLWPSSWLVRGIVRDKLSMFAGYTHIENLPILGVVPVVDEEVRWAARIAAWASWFAMRKWHAEQQIRAKEDALIEQEAVVSQEASAL